MKPTISAFFLFIVTVVISAPARADIPPPDVEPCTGKTAGAACTYGSAGTCRESTCNSPSPPPSGSTYACIRCVTGTATSTATATNTDTSSGDSWCSVGKGSTASRFVPWLMAATFSLLFLFGRRRRQK
jgi:MYXO-CTERM domain-containing protein